MKQMNGNAIKTKPVSPGNGLITNSQLIFTEISHNKIFFFIYFQIFYLVR